MKRFLALDALRGVAALIVVLCHTQPFSPWAPRFGHLAVDIFFLLSGFVLAFNYEPRFRAGFSFAEFIRARIIRLYPLYLLGLVVGIVFPPKALTVSDIWEATAANLFVLPSYIPRIYAIFPLNGPFWSLFFEFWVANLLFALLRHRLSWNVLMWLLGCSAVSMLVSEKIYHTFNVGILWVDFIPGFARVIFSFFTGVALSRLYRKELTLVLPAWSLILAVPFAMSIPFDGRIGQLYELSCVFFAFPLLIHLLAHAKDSLPRISSASRPLPVRKQR